MMNRWLKVRDALRLTLSHPWVRHVQIVVGLLLIAGLIFYETTEFSTKVSTSVRREIIPQERRSICELVTQEEPASVPIAVKTLLPGLTDYLASSAEKRRIIDQALKAQRLECMHMTLLEMYVRNYYGAVVVSMVFGGITAIALFFVGQKGWSTSSQYLINAFLTSAAITAFCGAFPGVFQQPMMVAAHKSQMLRYEALLDGMASHTSTSKLVPLSCTSHCTRTTGRVCDVPFPPADFIACIDGALSAADIPFGLDPGSLPDYRKAMETPNSATVAR